MSYEWENFYKFALKLKNTNFFQEDIYTKNRTIISRSYYAAFHSAQKFIKQNKLDEEIHSSGVHEKVIYYLKSAAKRDSNFQRKCKRLGFELERLKKNRVAADYEDNFLIEEKGVADHLFKTENIMQLIDELNHTYKK